MVMLNGHLFKCVCARCDHHFKYPVFVHVWGLVMRSPLTGEAVLIEMDGNTMDPELNRITNAMPICKGRRDHEMGGAGQAVFSAVYDPDPLGEPFVSGADPPCPKCGWTQLADWRSTEPPEMVKVDVPVATHHRWDAMTPEQRKQLVEQTVLDYFSTH
jgi:hypothetical protein